MGDVICTLPMSPTISSVILGSSSLNSESSNTVMILEAHSCCAWYRARSDSESLSAFEER